MESLGQLLEEYGRACALRDALFLAYVKELSAADLTKLSESAVGALLNAHTRSEEVVAQVKSEVVALMAKEGATFWENLLNQFDVAQPRPGNAPRDPNEPIITIDDRVKVIPKLIEAVKEEAAR